MAEARGIVLLVAGQKNLPVYEYTPNEIKKSLTGYGAATKTQISEMVRIHLGLEKKPKPDDAADAVAIQRECRQELGGREDEGGVSGGHWRLGAEEDRLRDREEGSGNREQEEGQG